MFLSTKAGRTMDGYAYTLSKLNAFFEVVPASQMAQIALSCGRLDHLNDCFILSF